MRFSTENKQIPRKKYLFQIPITIFEFTYTKINFFQRIIRGYFNMCIYIILCTSLMLYVCILGAV
jgi:hypothetical protein